MGAAMRRVATLLALCAAAFALGAGSARAAEWRSQQPPVGAGGIPTPIGPVGDIECWSPSRCVLITEGVDGNSSLPAGIYAYDGGEDWYLYSTVCGGHEGRIAWAGPTEFWTVSDMAKGQELDEPRSGHRRSLCHFKDGAVVASYGQPIGFVDSYEQMSAAACLTADECWFGGERLPGTVNVGAFHLYWTGISMLSVPSLTEQEPALEDPGRSVFDMAFHGGALYESVVVDDDDEAPGEPEDQPYFLHRILPGAPSAFESLAPEEPIEYGDGAEPDQLQGFHLSSDGTRLWAVSGATAKGAEVTALQLESGVLRQVDLEDGGSVFQPGDRINGLAAEPGSGSAWVTYRRQSEQGQGFEPAHVARLNADGTVDSAVDLPPEGEGVSAHGLGGPIECAGAGQCWMATKSGWLFHLGSNPGVDASPAMHVLITYRPPDPSLPTPPPAALPVDDSGLFAGEAQEVPLTGEEEATVRREAPLLSRLRQKLIEGRVLQLSFTLRARSRVRLIAWRKGKVVARTKRLTKAKGRRKIHLRLNRRRWPTRLDLRVNEVKRAGSRAGASG